MQVLSAAVFCSGILPDQDFCRTGKQSLITPMVYSRLVGTESKLDRLKLFPLELNCRLFSSVDLHSSLNYCRLFLNGINILLSI